MPCNSDHMHARPNEDLSRETAKLIVYLNGKLGTTTPVWITTAAEEYYGAEDRVDEVVAMLCETISGMTEEQRTAVVYDGKDPTARKLADWWDEHKLADEIREDAVAQAEAEAALVRRLMAEQTYIEIDASALAAAVEKLQSYTFAPGIESTLFRLTGPQVTALLAAAAKVA